MAPSHARNCRSYLAMTAGGACHRSLRQTATTGSHSFFKVVECLLNVLLKRLARVQRQVSARRTVRMPLMCPGPRGAGEVRAAVRGRLVQIAHLASARRALSHAAPQFVDITASKLDETVSAAVLARDPLTVFRDIGIVGRTVKDHAVTLAKEIVGEREQSLVCGWAGQRPFDSVVKQRGLHDVRVDNNGRHAAGDRRGELALADRRRSGELQEECGRMSVTVHELSPFLDWYVSSIRPGGNALLTVELRIFQHAGNRGRGEQFLQRGVPANNILAAWRLPPHNGRRGLGGEGGYLTRIQAQADAHRRRAEVFPRRSPDRL